MSVAKRNKKNRRPVLCSEFQSIVNLNNPLEGVGKTEVPSEVESQKLEKESTVRKDYQQERRETTSQNRENKLREENAELAKLVDSLEDKLCVLDPNPDIVGFFKGIVSRDYHILSCHRDLLQRERDAYANRLTQYESERLKMKDEFERMKHEKEELIGQTQQMQQDIEAYQRFIKEKDKTISEQSQLLINERTRNDSSICSSSFFQEGIDKSMVQSHFDITLDSISELLSALSKSVNLTNCPTFDQKKRIFHQKLIGCLFGDGLEKILRRERNMTEYKIANILSGKEDDEKEKEKLTNNLITRIEQEITKLIQVELGMETQTKGRVTECITDCGKSSLALFVSLTLCVPRMGVIVPKLGGKELFNPEKHEDATVEYEMLVSSIKRPGLICEVDNRVFSKASVETIFKRLTD